MIRRNKTIPPPPALLLMLVGCLLGVSSCSKREKPVGASPDRPHRLVEACALLTPEEVTAVLGAPVQDAKQSGKPGNDVAVSQCYFALPNNADSINLIVTQRADGASAGDRDPRKMWQSIFLEEKPPKVGRDGKEKPRPVPQRIAGIGDDAFWTGGRFGGTLNVLKGGTMVQISVGGSGDESAKLEKLKELARLIVARLG